MQGIYIQHRGLIHPLASLNTEILRFYFESALIVFPLVNEDYGFICAYFQLFFSLELNSKNLLKMKCSLWVFFFMYLENVDMYAIVKERICLFSWSTDCKRSGVRFQTWIHLYSFILLIAKWYVKFVCGTFLRFFFFFGP